MYNPLSAHRFCYDDRTQARIKCLNLHGDRKPSILQHDEGICNSKRFSSEQLTFKMSQEPLMEARVDLSGHKQADDDFSAPRGLRWSCLIWTPYVKAWLCPILTIALRYEYGNRVIEELAYKRRVIPNNLEYFPQSLKHNVSFPPTPYFKLQSAKNVFFDVAFSGISFLF